MAMIDPVFADRPGQTPADEWRRRQALAAELLKQGGDTTNVNSPFEAFGSLFQSGAGAYAQNQIRRQQAANPGGNDPWNGFRSMGTTLRGLY